MTRLLCPHHTPAHYFSSPSASSGLSSSSAFPVGTVWYRALPPIPGDLRESSWKYARWPNARAENFTLSTYLDADGPGFLYAFVDHGVFWKVGMSIDYDRRKAEWERQCPCPSRVWLPPMRVYGEGNPNHWPIFYWNWRASIGLEFIVSTVPRHTLKYSSSLVI
ncbi:hypothetical protein EV359DRAFT_69136, partial [Lentinula novae-zelandiae]